MPPRPARHDVRPWGPITPGAQGRPPAMSRILLVEDNELNRDMLSRRLARKGYEVAIAVDGHRALETARSASFDLILMDLSLPGIDGWSVARLLKADESTRGIPVIALTAHA